MPIPLTPEEEAAFWAELQRRDHETEMYKVQALANPSVAANLTQIHNAAPAAAPGVKLSLAQAVSAGMMPMQAAIAAGMSSYLVDTKLRVATAVQSGVREGQRSIMNRVGNDLTYAHRASKFGAKMSPEFADEIERRTGVRPTNVQTGPAPEFLESGTLPMRVAAAPIRGALGVAQSAYQGLTSAVMEIRKQQNYANMLTPEQADQIERETGVRPAAQVVRTPEQQAAGPPPESTVVDIARTTTLGQQVSDLYQRGTTDQGTGFFPGGQAEIRRREAERRVRGIIPGSGTLDANGNPIPGTEQTATLGRSMVQSVLEPGSQPYRVFSGAIDAGAAWYGDPANIALKGLTAARETRNLFTAADVLRDEHIARVLRTGETFVDHPTQGRGVWRTVDDTVASGARQATAVRQFVPMEQLHADARALRRSEAGVIDSHRWTVAPRGGEQWLASPEGMRFKADAAASSNFLDIWNATGRRIAPELAVEMTKAKTPEAIGELMVGELGASIRSTTDLSKVRSPGWWQSTRLSQQMPKARQLMAFNASTAERIDAVNNIDYYLANAHVQKTLGWEERSRIVGDFAQGLVTNAQDRYGALNNALQAVEKSLKAYGVDEYTARSLTHYAGDADVIRKWAVDRVGLPTDGGFLSGLQDKGYLRDHVDETLHAIGPQMLSEGLSDSAYLPNIREIRRLSSNWAWLTAEGGAHGVGKLKMPLAVIETIQNDYIKPLAIIRPAFILRVVGEEQFRMAAAGQASVVRHPLEWIQYAMHNSGAYDALGRDFEALAAKYNNFESWDELSASLHRGANGRGAKHLIDPLAAERDSFNTGSWTIVDKRTNPVEWEQGLATDEMRQMHADVLTSRVAAGQSNDEITTWLRSEDPDAVKISNELRSLLANKAARDSKGNWVSTYMNADDDVVLHAYLDSLRDRLDTKVGQNPELLGAIAHGHIGQEELTLVNKDVVPLKDGAGPRVLKDPFKPDAGYSTWVGTRVKVPDGRIGVVVNDADVAGHSLVQVGAKAWDEAGRPSQALRAAVKDWREIPDSPQAVKYAVRAKARLSGSKGEAALRATQMRDLAVNGFFSGLYGRSSDYLSRSPSWRQFYWQRMTELADRLAPDEANIFLKNMATAAANHTENSVAKLLGGNKAVDRAIAAAGRADGTLSVAQLDDYARGWALDKTKRLLYDASRRTQWADVARVIFPFGEAWKEVVGTWGRMILRDPRLVRRGQLVIQGGRDFDPDGDGRGFFNVDPTTGKEQFTIPFSSEIGRYITGGGSLEKVASPFAAKVFGGAVPVDTPMNVQLDRLNIGFSVMPGVGWVAAAALGTLLPDKPAFDQVRNFLLPYGTDTNTLTNVIVPSWAQKIWQGTFDSPQSPRLYGDTYLRTVQYLLATGEYGTSADEQDRLKADATKQARATTVIRGIAQAFGPAAPTVDYNLKVQPKAKPGELALPPEMHVLTATLTKEYSRMQQEDPQNAMENFTALYGDLAMSFTVGRSRAVNGGLSQSKVFGAWERNHGKVFSVAPDIAGYFAPVGDDLDMAVRARQLSSGQREKLSDNDFLSAVNETVGNRIYYALRDQLYAQNATVGRKTLTGQQAEWLRNAREKIYDKFPVPNPQAGDRAGFKDQIRQLVDVVDHKQLADNDIADAARTYLRIRNAVLDEVKRRGGAGLSGGDMGDLRAYLTSAGVALTQRTPKFARLWDSVLSREVEA